MKLIRPLFKVLFLISVSNYSLCFGQSNPGQSNMPTIANVLPVSPNAASLGKYGEVPVGYYTGIPNISLPIYEINTGALKLPISLSYHAGGVRVEDMASWVGLEWSLNAGGIITREVRGLPDETPTAGYLQSSNQISQYIAGMTPNQKQQYLDNIADGIIDSQQDLFTYNIGGESGKFILDPSGSVVTMPNSKNKFEFGAFEGLQNSWKITDVNGIQYFFTVQEHTNAVPVTNGSLSPNPPPSAVTSWYLSKIVNAEGTDQITFTYEGAPTQFTTIGNQTKYIFQYGTCDQTTRGPDVTYSDNTVVGYRLASINFKNGSVVFNRNTQQRCDYPGDYALNSIEIKNTDGTFYKKYVLNQSYLSSNTEPCDINHPENTRLFLDGVEIWDRTSLIGRYQLSYNKQIQVPSRKSYNQDYWGYYNGANNGTDFVPQSDVQRMTTSAVITGADRMPNPNYTQAGMLTSIIYPTGGKTVFEYENNRANNYPVTEDEVLAYKSQTFGPTSLYQDVTFNIDDAFAGQNSGNVAISLNNGGGDCGVAQSLTCPIVTLYTPDNQSYNILSSDTKILPAGSYRVTIDLTGVSDPNVLNNFYLSFTWASGAMNDPNYSHNMLVGGLRVKTITDYSNDNTTAMVKNYKYTMPGDAQTSSGSILSFPSYTGTQDYETVSCRFTTISSSSNYPMSTAQGSYVQYSYVEELLGSNGEFGKNTYGFSTADDRVYANFPYAPSTTFEWKRGQSLYQKTYRYNHTSNTYELIKEHINQYADNGTNVYQNLKTGQDIFKDPGEMGIAEQRQYEVQQYSNESGWSPLTSETDRIYNQTDLSKYVETTHSYTYGTNHYLPITETTKNSKGEIITTYLKYPLDYIGLSGTSPLTLGIKNLQEKNVVAPVIEKNEQLQKPDGASLGVTSSQLTSYRTDSPVPDVIWSTEFAAPSSNFTPSAVASGDIQKSDAYKPQVQFLNYDGNGNIIEQRKVNDVTRAYIWDYSGAYPICEAINSDYASIAYTSFEADGTGNWSGIISSNIVSSGGLTGNKFLSQSNFSISRSGLNASSTYTVSYWSKNGSIPYSVNGTSGTAVKSKDGWTCFEHTITNPSSGTITITGSGALDELRLYPKAAQMTTYCYLPLVGMTCKCDPSNHLEFYEYDYLGRMKLIRDQDGYILKSMDYKYNSQ